MRPRFLNNAIRRKGMIYRLDWKALSITFLLMALLLGAWGFVSWVDQQIANSIEETQLNKYKHMERTLTSCLNGAAIQLDRKSYMECKMNYQLESL